MFLLPAKEPNLLFKFPCNFAAFGKGKTNYWAMKYIFHPEALTEYAQVVLYTIESDYILILAVMPCSRKPGYWKERRSVEEN